MSERCPHCGNALPPTTLPRLIEQSLTARAATAVDQIKQSARTAYPEATDKQIYNALSMLVRHNRVRRVGYGLYSAPPRIISR